MRHLGLFEGIGGFSLAAHWMGWDTVAWVEIDKRCQELLKQHFPNAKGHGDIKGFDGTEYWGTIDILTGGFPCQTFSLAGKGATDLTLWKEMFRVIREIRPKVVVAENVYGILARKKGMALSVVYDDLESAGYTTMPPLIIPAAGAGAWHRRDRVWIVAYSNSIEPKRNRGSIQLAGTQGTRESKGHEREWFRDAARGGCENVPYPDTSRLEVIECKHEDNEKKLSSIERICDGWEYWNAEPAVGRVANGIPDRVDRIKGLGNAIVPQVAYEIFKAIDQVMRVREST